MSGVRKIIGFNVSYINVPGTKILSSKGEEIKIVSTLGQAGNYPLEMSNGLNYSLRGKCELKTEGRLKMSIILRNPIKDNRIVSDFTFATRLKHFLEDIEVCDAMGSEELDYFKHVADLLLEWQLKTCSDQSELDYFKNLGVDVKKEPTIE